MGVAATRRRKRRATSGVAVVPLDVFFKGETEIREVSSKETPPVVAIPVASVSSGTELSVPEKTPTECYKDETCMAKYADYYARGFGIHEVKSLFYRAITRPHNYTFKASGRSVDVKGEPYLYEMYADSTSPVGGSGKNRLAVIARADNGKVAAAYVYYDFDTGEVYDAFFSPDCDETCVEHVKGLIRRNPLPYKATGRGVKGGIWEWDTIKLYDFGWYYDKDGVQRVKVYSMYFDGHVFVDVLHDDKSLGGTLMYSLKLSRDKLAEWFAPYAKKLVELVGRENARGILEAVLKDQLPTEDKYINDYLDKLFNKL